MTARQAAGAMARGSGRNGVLGSALGIDDRMFAAPAERRMLRAIEDGLEQVEEGLAAELRFGDQLADTTARYLFEAGGKRVRPALTLLTSQLGSGVNPAVIRSAQAVELTHLASLYHDDVMDEADLRRGVQTAHRTWGNSVAILTGDLLFARASAIISSLGGRALELQARTFERLVLGQLHETVGPAEGEDPVDHYLSVLADKTGSLITLAGLVGLIFSEAPEPYYPAISEFGERIGVAFQLIDDVIDITDAAETTGKAPGTDLRADVPTLPMLLLRRAAESDPDARALVERIETTAALDDDAVFLSAVAALRANAVSVATITEARRWADAAVAALAPLPAGPVKRALAEFAERVVERKA